MAKTCSRIKGTGVPRHRASDVWGGPVRRAASLLLVLLTGCAGAGTHRPGSAASPPAYRPGPTAAEEGDVLQTPAPQARSTPPRTTAVARPALARPAPRVRPTRRTRRPASQAASTPRLAPPVPRRVAHPSSPALPPSVGQADRPRPVRRGPVDPTRPERLARSQAPPESTPAPPSGSPPSTPAPERGPVEDPSPQPSPDLPSPEPVAEPPRPPVLTPPRPIATILPDYPGAVVLTVRRSALSPEAVVGAPEGRVRLRLLVRADGTVGSVEVLVSSGFPELDRAAQDALRRWRFEPATRDGVPIDAYYLVWVTFELRGP